MTIRSSLFATVALPLLSVTIGLQPALADAQFKPFQVAQSDEEEILKRRAERRQQREAQQEQGGAQEENNGGQSGDQPSDAERQRIREERRKQRAAQQEQQAQPERQAQPADNGGEPSDAERQRIREERRKQRAAQQQDEQAEPEQQAQPADESGQPSAEERKRIREERRKQREAGQQQAEPEQQAEPAENGGEPSDAERQRIREERRKQRAAQQDEAQPADQAQPADDGNGEVSNEERARIRAERRKQREAQQQDQAQPETDAAGDEAQPRERRARDIVDKRSREERQRIARDPSASDDTVVLPVDNGAAVLDSDKDADNRGGGDARERRRRQREQARAEREKVPAPRSDADAQIDHRDRRPSRDQLNAAINERGRRVDQVPEFNADDLLDAFTGRRPRIEEGRNNRTVLDFGDEIVVRSDDRPRLRRDARDSYYEELARGRTREVIERPNGIRVVTIYNRYGDVIQRTRINRDGQEYLMVYAPEVDEDNRPPIIDAGEDLPPMRLTVPVRDYIIDTSTEPDRNYYDFLAEPPVERVERTYSLDEVRNSARIRDKVRRIDLDTITFATGSAEVPMSQAKTLRKVADAMLEVIDKDPGETFLIEGHTDAVGSDPSNLVLSDERAESVASLLTDVYQIPPENLVTQGYGERFLKVDTDAAEQENRRVTIRRVTPLVRPVAQN